MPEVCRFSKNLLVFGSLFRARESAQIEVHLTQRSAGRDSWRKKNGVRIAAAPGGARETVSMITHAFYILPAAPSSEGSRG
jgi:hypothetical protein